MTVTDPVPTEPTPSGPGAADAATPRRNRTVLLVTVAVGVVLAVLIIVLATSDPGAREASSPLLGRQAPTLAGESLVGDGGAFDVADPGGRFTLVNFFATWCVPCIEEHPELVRFAEAHDRIGDARVVTVVLQDEPEAVASFFEDEGGDWPVLADPSAQFAAEWGVSAPPESYLVAPDGTVIAKVIGGVTAEYLDSLLDRAMGRGGS